MRKLTLLAALFALVMFPAYSGDAPLVPAENDVATSNQFLMRDKLKHAQNVLEGITTENFAMVEENARMLGIISRASSWHALPTPEYQRYSKNFAEAVHDLDRNAKEKSIDGATLDYVQMTMACVECHKHLRDVKHAQSLEK
ncbi:hypothetical protein Pan216_05340 [Planctomycetes bacterium Pan216]|uniref:Cytochrome C n=1 Tax=Kolteria novifilia TaxID=2527975 RepID=A0A518AYA7_9BACT|nr:hypothetical protein Pan216_05340 [Planctomycetes bacterium Pan216]